MFHQPPHTPPPAWKRPVYLLSSVVLWLFLGVFLQIVLLVFIDRDKQLATFSLTTWWRPLLVLVFGAAGYFIGRQWWRWVYIERRWWKTPPSRSNA